MSQRKIGQIFVDMGFITDEQLVLLLEEQQQQPGALLGKLAEDMALITDEQLAQALGEQMNMKVVTLGDDPIPKALLEKLTDVMAQLYRVVPVKFDGSRLTIATCDPQNLTVQDELRTFLGLDIEMVVATEREIKATIDRFYSPESLSVEKIIADLNDDEELFAAASKLQGDKFDLDGAEALADSAPVRKLLNRSRTSFGFGSRPRGSCTRWSLHRVTWPSPSRPGSRSWPIWTLPSAACPRTVGLN
jgi:type IV pilus assembly protein PilB